MSHSKIKHFVSIAALIFSVYLLSIPNTALAGHILIESGTPPAALLAASLPNLAIAQKVKLRIGKHSLTSQFTYQQPPEIKGVDLNFDEWTDIWITGCTDGQCRNRVSDVWLYSPKSKTFVYHTQLSSMSNLSVSATQQLLQSGIDNAGCAGMNFYYDVYQWERGALLAIHHREQSCEETGLLYREYSIRHGMKGLIYTEHGGEDEETQQKRRFGEFKPSLQQR
ncbi:hypothetical protein LIN78_15115 [Leeia sp. TBRC 13508]|uniref:Lipoprotein n=1 Tax=Leeia speluncae TaxID=2884804 RepID=A0ABS8D9S4_9NEIS|nr:hypothetical protein [Leeia speluncae]MCB6184877.1 hypothetical protein [Leeia speluncae]